jgi:hypothetical protein
VIDGFLHPRRTRAPRFEAWGMVESIQGLRHVQSWFIHLDATVLASPAVRRIFDQPFSHMHKKEIVARGELALAAALDAEGVHCGAVFDRGQASTPGRIVPSNPMHLDWRHLLTSRRVPFLKGELLRANPLAVPWVREWPAVLARVSDFPVAWIHDHLYSYVGREPPYPGAPFPTPCAPIGWRAKVLQVLLTRDRLPALRSMMRLRRAGR